MYKKEENQLGNHAQKRTGVLEQTRNYEGIDQATKDSKCYVSMSTVRRTKENYFAPLGLIQGLSCSTSSSRGHRAFRKLKVKSLWLNMLAPTHRPALTTSSSSSNHIVFLRSTSGSAEPTAGGSLSFQINLNCVCHSARHTSLTDAMQLIARPSHGRVGASPRNSNEIGKRCRQL